MRTSSSLLGVSVMRGETGTMTAIISSARRGSGRIIHSKGRLSRKRRMERNFFLWQSKQQSDGSREPFGNPSSVVMGKAVFDLDDHRWEGAKGQRGHPQLHPWERSSGDKEFIASNGKKQSVQRYRPLGKHSPFIPVRVP